MSRVTTSRIYSEQNKILFGLLKKIGIDYQESRDMLLAGITATIGREVDSLTELTLSERNRAIAGIADNASMSVRLPGLPTRLADWKKGDKDRWYDVISIPLSSPFAKNKRYILGLWLALGYEPKAIDARCKKQFGVDRFAWLNDGMAINTLSKDLWTRCKRAGINPEPV